ncbi:MAG TPA: hypothetical protein PKG71_02385 [Candidatus Woesebacteria bacterium]|nr:hypothetical protein [Candidatus Woesebacteria bacterium]HNS94793.1 hypothetical protein [Candidatus Woesebacteria bacterium]
MHSVHYINTAGGIGLAQAFATHHANVFVRTERLTTESEALATSFHQKLTAHPPFTVNEATKLLAPYRDQLDIALLVHKEQTLTLATTGSGIIFLKRNEKIIELVAEGNIAQGPPMRGDEYVLTSGEFVDVSGGLEGFAYYFTHYTGPEVVELMKTSEDQSVVRGFVSVQYGTIPKLDPSVLVVDEQIVPPSALDVDTQIPISSSQKETVVETSPNSNAVTTSLPSAPHFERIRMPKIKFTVPRRRYVALIVLVVILLGVGLRLAGGRMGWLAGEQNRSSGFAPIEVEIAQRMQDAKESSFSEVSQLGQIFADMHALLDGLDTKEQEKYANEIAQLQETIAQKERELMKIVQEEPVEFFDFGLFAKGALAQDIDFIDDTFYILDGAQGSVYTVDTNRAQGKFTSDKYKGATQVTSTGRHTYVLTQRDGIYLVDKDSSVQVVPPDPSWGTITDMKAYTGNLYLLDSAKRTIVKYQGVDERTFGSVSPYLVPELQGALQETKGMMIDGAIYVLGTQSIRKFSVGKRVDFKLSIPYAQGNFSALYTNPEIDALYVFDDVHKVLYELSKEGPFKRVWRVPHEVIAGGATEESAVFVVTEDKIYSLGE